MRIRKEDTCMDVEFHEEVNEDAETYVIAPKGIFFIALETAKIIEDINDPRLDAAWMIFELMMEKHGYIGQRGEQNEGI